MQMAAGAATRYIASHVTYATRAIVC